MSREKPLSMGAVRGMTATFFGALVLIFGWLTGYFDGAGVVEPKQEAIEPLGATFERHSLDEIGCAEDGVAAEQGQDKKPSLTEQARVALSNSDYARAVSLCRKALVAEPDDPTIRRNLSTVLTTQAHAIARAGDSELALAHYLEAAEYDANGGRPAASRARLLFDLGRLDEADAILADLKQEFPNRALVWQISGSCARAFGHLDQAVSDWSRAIELDAAFAENLQPHLDAARAEIAARASYLLKSTSHFDLRYNPLDVGMAARIPAIEQALDQAYDAVSALWGLHPSQRTEVLVLRRGESDAVGWASGLYDGRIRLILDDETREVALSRTMRHEHTHAAFHRLGLTLPTWINEGCAEIAAGASIDRARAYLADALSAGQVLPTPAELRSRWTTWSDADRVRMAYSYATSFLSWLQSQFGDSSPRLLFERVPSQGFDKAVGSTFGKSLSALEAEHRAWLLSM
ncbi:MAG: tetratricopeptide repeat protein [Planctomycetes bacterium]|jgi:tetratricopeptide (TPR) repeat protein|nr:tetratricopeptide repeat protein [Planctomycetota bacterium]MBT4028124.1 tetratricopeptide repeat protein [Planctomycetota bacterium]MBT4560751.1 tetratricopeptide repeat protein [Planctomycetota bacterium]MBT5101803.1 tetratricopeptide repeat protein [Planctomycetota bacterium]MBT5121084.1 tetratricopeptide repeat protein [Planctomycetota bacterium]